MTKTYNHPYWLNAILIGTALNISLFMSLHNLGKSKDIPEPAIMVIDFMEWREPVQRKPATRQVRKKPKLRTIKKQNPVEKPIVNAKPILTKEISTRQHETVTKPVQAQAQTFEESLPIPLPFYKATTLPRFAHLANLEDYYPPNKRKQGIEGKVKVEVLIDKYGKARKVTILTSAGDEFDDAAIKAIMASSFIPANFAGKPGPVLYRIPVEFRLK